MQRLTVGIIFALSVALCLSLSAATFCSANNKAGIIEGEPLVLHFDKGITELSDGDKAKIKQRLEDLKFTAGDKILVVGHTDSGGDTKKNIKLSYQRAQTVRRQIINGIGGINAKDIIAIGRGDENPVADNSSQAGRAQNRRVEIYLAQVVSGRLKGKNNRIDPDKAAVELLVENARSMLRHHQLQEALRSLNQALAQGGDQFSSWQGVFGIAGYYAGMASEKVRIHLSTALQLDPFNQEARDYLGRVEAREKVASGAVTAQMGRSATDAILVATDSQTYEYLRLFGVQPISHYALATGSIEVWKCRDPNGSTVLYHFDRSQVFDWIYTPSISKSDAPVGLVTPALAPLVSQANDSTKHLDKSASTRVWESKLFR